MPEPIEAFLPDWAETKLSKTSFGKLMRLRNEAKEKAQEYIDAIQEYEAQIAALMVKANLDAVRINGYTPRWVAEGKPGRKLVPELVLTALKGNTDKFNGCFEETKPRAAYFAIYAPKGAQGE